MRKYLGIALILLSTAAWSQTDDTANPYVRKPRKAAVSAELGMNSLASLIGIEGSFFVQKQVAVDVGLGISTTGLRPGVYARYLFSDAKFSPFVYGGLKYGLGSGNTPVEATNAEDASDPTTYPLKVKPSPFLDLGFGIDYLADGGFYFKAVIGWSSLLGGTNYEWVNGSAPNQKTEDTYKLILGGGPALAFSLGYAF